MTVAQGTPKYRAGENLGEDVKFAFARVNQLEAENAALSAQVVELQKDAERYQFCVKTGLAPQLCGHDTSQRGYCWYFEYGEMPEGGYPLFATANEAIDHARQKCADEY